VEEAVRLKALALAKCQQELAKLGVPPDDLLMQAPEGPGPSRQEIWQIPNEDTAKKTEAWGCQEFDKFSKRLGTQSG
jgi:hypothetical protein